jgi:hypothetical protein
VNTDDRYTKGWQDADEAIRYKLPGYQSYSQGTTDWDKGWNARLDKDSPRHGFPVAVIYVNGEKVQTVVGMRSETEQELRARIEVVIAITRETSLKGV